jgi:hypothetical protein
VLCLYNWVKKQPKESIRSLQVFSHGWMGGPIIWNSSEFDSDGNHMEALDGQDRDPHDTDFRMRDFVGSNPLAGAEGAKFAQAFTPTALIKLWGCVAPTGMRGKMQRYIGAPEGKRGDQARKAHLLDYLTRSVRAFRWRWRHGWISPCGRRRWASAPIPARASPRITAT